MQYNALTQPGKVRWTLWIMIEWQEKRDSWSVLYLLFFCFFSFPPLRPSSFPSQPGGLCLDSIEFSRVIVALSCLCMVTVSAVRVLSPALPTTPTYSLASNSQSADLCCWGDLVFYVSYLKSTITSLYRSLSFPLYCVLALLQSHNVHLTHSPLFLFALYSPIPLLFNLFLFPSCLMLHISCRLYLWTFSSPIRTASLMRACVPLLHLAVCVKVTKT